MEGLFQGIWYRSTVKLRGDTISPIPPFEPYNPFKFYYSPGDVRQGKRSLYLEFLAVDASKPEEVVNFCQRFGVLGSSARVIEKWLPIQIDSILDNIKRGVKIIEPGGSHKKDFLEIIGNPHPGSVPLNEVYTKMKLVEFKDSQKILQKVVSVSKEHNPTDKMKNFIQGKFITRIRASRIQPGLRWNPTEARWELCWESLDLLGLLWVMAMLDLLGPGKVHSCPRCHKFFMTASNKVKFCSPSCYEVFKVQKYQKKKKEEELAAKKGKKGKATKSTGKKK